MRGGREWEMEAYDLETGWVNAREIMGHRRASRAMRRLREMGERDVAFALYCIARMIDEEIFQKRRLLINIPYNNVYIRVQQGHSAAQTPNPELSQVQTHRGECMVRST